MKGIEDPRWPEFLAEPSKFLLYLNLPIFVSFPFQTQFSCALGRWKARMEERVIVDELVMIAWIILAIL